MNKSIGNEKRFKSTVERILKGMFLTAGLVASLSGELEARQIVSFHFQLNPIIISNVQPATENVSMRYLTEIIDEGITDNINLVKINRHRIVTINQILRNNREREIFINRLSNEINIKYSKSSRTQHHTKYSKYHLSLRNFDVSIIENILRSMGKDYDLIDNAKITELDTLVAKRYDSRRVSYKITHDSHQVKVNVRRWSNDMRNDRMGEDEWGNIKSNRLGENNYEERSTYMKNDSDINDVEVDEYGIPIGRAEYNSYSLD